MPVQYHGAQLAEGHPGDSSAFFPEQQVARPPEQQRAPGWERRTKYDAKQRRLLKLRHRQRISEAGTHEIAAADLAQAGRTRCGLIREGNRGVRPGDPQQAAFLRMNRAQLGLSRTVLVRPPA